MDKKTMRKLGLSLLFTAMSFGGMKAEAKETVKNDKEISFYFSPQRLVKAIDTAGASVAEANAFCKYYLQYMNQDCRVSAESLLRCARQSGLSAEQTKKLFKSLAEDGNQPSSYGYNYGNFSLSYNISSGGFLNRLDYKSDCEFNENDVRSLHEARCRHCKLATDDMREKFNSKNMLVELLVYKDVKQKLQKGIAVPNGEKFAQHFEDKLARNGLEINAQGKFQGIEASKGKKLYTAGELQQEHRRQQEAAYRQYLAKRSR